MVVNLIVINTNKYVNQKGILVSGKLSALGFIGVCLNCASNVVEMEFYPILCCSYGPHVLTLYNLLPLR